MSDPGPDVPEWTDSAADHHRDLTVLSAAVRGELDRAVRTVNATLGMTGKQPATPDPPPSVAAGNAGFPAATSPGQAPDAALASNVGRRRHPYLYAFPAERGG